MLNALTHPPPNSETPTLAINSGAILDILSGTHSEESANAYQKSKLALIRVPGLYNFIPGFFIQDLKDPDWASKGHHGDTTDTVFQNEFVKDFAWDKAYRVTPKSILVNTILSWIQNPEHFSLVTRVCSEIPYKRSDLRALSEINPPTPKITYDDVIQACVKARRLRQ